VELDRYGGVWAWSTEFHDEYREGWGFDGRKNPGEVNFELFVRDSFACDGNPKPFENSTIPEIRFNIRLCAG